MRYTNTCGLALGLLLLACSQANDSGNVPGAAGAGGETSGEAGAAPSEAGGGGADGVAAVGGAGESGSAPGEAGKAATFECDGDGARFVTHVVDSAFGEGQDHGQAEFPGPILGAPLGGGCCMGALDVTSLGEGGFVIVEFEGNVIADGDGPDFIVFENPFVPQGADPSAVFAEVGSVSVSQDGVTWYDYPCTAEEYPFGDCAGWHAVLANANDNEISPFDPETAGGDAFDLAALDIEWARYVRIEDRADVEGAFDLDAVAIVNAGCD